MSQLPVFYPDSLSPLESEREFILTFPDQTLGVYTTLPSGVKAIPRQELPGGNSWISLILLLCFLLVAGSYRSSNKFIRYIISETIEYKQRSSFNQTSTLNLVRLKVMMLAMTFIIEGLALFMIFRHYHPVNEFTQLKSLAYIGIFTALFVTSYLLQLSLYAIITNTFSNKTNRNLVSGALSGITILRGLLLFIPVLVSIYHSIPFKSFIFITVSLYFATRLLFIYKGVKIFFRDFYSLIYVVLYLCTLEIAPLLVIYKGLFWVFSFVELKLI
ncbi:MAG: DUF4271 domain-containing protein [Bacteroidales bacterium]